LPVFKRTHTCGDLRKTDDGREVSLAGWVRRVRDLGGLTFVDLRDRYGRTQVVFEEPGLAERANALGREFFIGVSGRVRPRPEKDRNPEMPTGEIEVVAGELTILAESKTPPFLVEDETDASEELRLRYRYLDLRRPWMMKKLETRSKAASIIRNYLWEKGFLEIETPLLAKSTPEGARDFLVPCRLQKGKFYALPQSPQIYKQILIIAGVDRYFQIAKCLRDEDLRADRQPEHTQVDIEMALATPDDVYGLAEGFMARLFGEILGVELPTPFPRMSYADAMARYGSDKPDLRFGVEIADLTETYRGKGFGVLDGIMEKGGVVLGIEVPCELSRKETDNYTAFVQGLGAGGLLWFRPPESGPLAKYTEKSLVKEGNTLLVLAGQAPAIQEIAGALRSRVARDKNLIPGGVYKPLWVEDFPLFEWNEDEGRIRVAPHAPWGVKPMHHVFTIPHPDDLGKLAELEALVFPPGSPQPSAVSPQPPRWGPGEIPGALTHLLRDTRGLQYDLVINGAELASGSIRCHDPALQKRLLRIAGLNPANFSFLLEALEYGAPPHGGIAPGFDRIVAMLCGEESIREVIAFPKTTSGSGLMEGSPSEVEKEQLGELGIDLRENEG
jgi:aspartyl-tRNA synthetase